MELGPILRFELIRTSRWRRHYVIRGAIGLILVYAWWALSVEWQRSAASGGPVRPDDPRNIPRFADLLFLELAWWQGLAIVLVLPALVAGSIAEEDRRGTMLHMLATPLSSLAIVLGKLAARLVHVGVVLAVGLPVVVPMALVGALDPSIVADAYALLIFQALGIGSLSMLVSVVLRRPRLVILVAYVLVGGWLLLPMGLNPTPGRLWWPPHWTGHPGESAFFLWVMTATRLYWPPDRPWAQAGFSRAFPRFLMSQAAVSILLLILAAVCLRPLRLGLWSWSGCRRTLSARPRPAVGDDPMLWKEHYASPRPWRMLACTAIIVLGAFLFGPLGELAGAAFREWWMSWWDADAMVWRRRDLNELLREWNAGLYLIGLFAVAAIGAMSVAGERERGTWTSLNMTPLTGREVVRAKVSGTLRAVRGLSIPFLIFWGIGLATGSAHPVGVLAAALGLVIFARYAAAIGVLASMLSSTTERAIGTTFLALLVSNTAPLLFIPLDLIGRLAGSWPSIYLAGVTPFVEWLSLVSPVEIVWWSHGRAWDGSIRLPGAVWGARMNLGPGLFRIFVASLALHAVATTALLRAAAWVFDSRRDGLGVAGVRSSRRAAGRIDRACPTIPSKGQ